MSFGFFKRLTRRASGTIFVLLVSCNAPDHTGAPVGGDVGIGTIDVNGAATFDVSPADVLLRPDIDAPDVHDASSANGLVNDYPHDLTWTGPAWPSECTPDDATVTTIGPTSLPSDTGLPGLPDKPCLAQACALCGPTDLCTCGGDGNTPCAWKKIAPLPFPLKLMSHTWGDGKLYLWGGQNSNYEGASADPFKEAGYVPTAEIWDPISDTWTVTPPAPVYSEDVRPGVAYGGGKLYVMGTCVTMLKFVGAFVELPWGPTYSDIAAYDPKNSTWAALPSVGSPGACGSEGGMAFLAGKLVVPGCWASYPPPSYSMGPPAAFDPPTGQWQPLPPMPEESSRPWTIEAVSGDDAAGWNLDPKGDPVHLMVFHGDSWTWSLHPAPLGCAPPGASWTLVGFPDGFLATSKVYGFSMAPGAGEGIAAYIWWKKSSGWESVPLPLWILPQTYSAAWAGEGFVFWESEGAAFNPQTRAWRQLAWSGRPSERDRGVATSFGNRFLYIGGKDLNSGLPLNDGGGILVPGL